MNNLQKIFVMVGFGSLVLIVVSIYGLGFEPNSNFFFEEVWEKNNWIVEEDPYGWFQWYCRFYNGRRIDDDERQIKRWLNIAGPNGRFRRRLMNKIIQTGKKYNDKSVSPVIRQVLLHWGYELTKEDLRKYKEMINKKKS
mgnify:CR=1 FL=1